MGSWDSKCTLWIPAAFSFDLIGWIVRELALAPYPIKTFKPAHKPDIKLDIEPADELDIKLDIKLADSASLRAGCRNGYLSSQLIRHPPHGVRWEAIYGDKGNHTTAQTPGSETQTHPLPVGPVEAPDNSVELAHYDSNFAENEQIVRMSKTVKQNKIIPTRHRRT